MIGRRAGWGLLLLIQLLLSCSGGETGTGEDTDQGTMYIGSISAFGSIFVNGFEFDTDKAVIVFDGEQVGQEKLSQGMVVQVEGNIDSLAKGIADHVTYNTLLRGQIDSIGQGSMTVLGQTVLTDENTLFYSKVDAITGIEQLQPGNSIEISGFPGMHSFLASYIRVLDSAAIQDHLVVSGLVEVVTSQFVRLNNLTAYFNKDSASQFINLRTGVMARLIGHYQMLNDSQRFIIDEVYSKQQDKVDRMLDMEAYVVEPLNEGYMRVNVMPVLVSAGIDIRGGSLDALKHAGTRVQVYGHLSHGVLEAYRILIKEAPSVELVSEIEQVDPDQNSFRIFARNIGVNNHTIFKDDRSQPLQSINVRNLATGDRIHCSMQFDLENHVFVATMVQRVDSSTDPAMLRGPMLSVEGRGANLMVNIAGLELELAAPDAHLFYNREPGTIVTVTGSYNSTKDVFIVNTVEFSM